MNEDSESTVVKKTFFQNIYNQQKCLVCGMRFNIVGILGKNQVINSTCTIHPHHTTTCTENGYHLPAIEYGGSCSVCDLERLPELKERISIHEKHNLVRLGCTKIAHIGSLWPMVNDNTIETQLLERLKNMVKGNYNNSAFSTANSFSITEKETVIKITGGFIDISRGIYVLPLFILKHIMEKQKQYQKQIVNPCHIPYESDKIIESFYMDEFSESELDEIYYHFCNTERKKYSPKKSNAPQNQQMLIFDTPSKFVSKFISFTGITKNGTIIKHAEDSDEQIERVIGTDIYNPTLKLNSGRLAVSFPLLSAYNSMLTVCGIEEITYDNIYKHVKDSDYLKDFRRWSLHNVKISKSLIGDRFSIKKRNIEELYQPKSYGKKSTGKSTDLTQDDDSDDESQKKDLQNSDSDIPMNQNKKQKNDQLFEYLHRKSESERQDQSKNPTSLLEKYQKKTSTVESQDFSDYYNPIPHRSTITAPKGYRFTSKPTSKSLEIPIIDKLTYLVSAEGPMESHELATRIKNTGTVGALEPSIGIFPNGNTDHSVLSGLNTYSRIKSDPIQESVSTIYTAARMQLGINKIQQSSLNSANQSKYQEALNRMKQHLLNNAINNDLFVQFRMLMQSSFDRSTEEDVKLSVFRQWNGFNNNSGKFLPFAIILNAEFTLF